MQMMQGFGVDDASDALVFGKEPLPIVGENVTKFILFGGQVMQMMQVFRGGDVRLA